MPERGSFKYSKNWFHYSNCGIIKKVFVFQSSTQPQMTPTTRTFGSACWKNNRDEQTSPFSQRGFLQCYSSKLVIHLLFRIPDCVNSFLVSSMAQKEGLIIAWWSICIKKNWSCIWTILNKHFEYLAGDVAFGLYDNIHRLLIFVSIFIFVTDNVHIMLNIHLI